MKGFGGAVLGFDLGHRRCVGNYLHLEIMQTVLCRRELNLNR